MRREVESNGSALLQPLSAHVLASCADASITVTDRTLVDRERALSPLHRTAKVRHV